MSEYPAPNPCISRQMKPKHPQLHREDIPDVKPIHSSANSSKPIGNTRNLHVTSLAIYSSVEAEFSLDLEVTISVRRRRAQPRGPQLT